MSNDESEKLVKNSDDDKELAEIYMHSYFDTVKYSNARENEVSDLIITTEIQASAIFIALAGVLMVEKNLQIVSLVAVFVGIVLLAMSIVSGVLNLLIKHKFWINTAGHYKRLGRGWLYVREGKVTRKHAETMLNLFRHDDRRTQSVIWPVWLQTILLMLGLSSILVGLLLVALQT